MTVAKTPSPAPNLIELEASHPNIDVASLLAEAASTAAPPCKGKAADAAKLRGLITAITDGRPHLKGESLVNLIERCRTDGGTYGPTERRVIQRIGREERQKAIGRESRTSRTKISQAIADRASVTVPIAAHLIPSPTSARSPALTVDADGRPVSCIQQAPGLLFKSGPEIRMFFSVQTRKGSAADLFLAARRIYESVDATANLSDLEPASRQMVWDCWKTMGLSQ
jgi:hypothetical protein